MALSTMVYLVVVVMLLSGIISLISDVSFPRGGGNLSLVGNASSPTGVRAYLPYLFLSRSLLLSELCFPLGAEERPGTYNSRWPLRCVYIEISICAY